ncbi:hypothetical protein EOD39_20352 [Acipenser ruthenus]|uniref:3-dehydroquinate synthase C-terminal domain-containing protein n=1 Tax=Acipenser ruthenus TaxID=7906 RepID=A0A444UVM5_ACIRT|nr:hypothetical protein EOD39_20352 [Acipenser ruthenus]
MSFISYESTSEQGKSWTIVSPIYFRYKVVESQNLLEPGNDTLLTGHLRDPGQLDAFRSSTKPIKRFVVIDETVNQLYGPQKVLPTLMHGEAVNIDMAYMTYVSNDRGFLTTAERNRIIQCMKNLELPVWHHDFSLNLVKKSLNESLKHSEGLQRMPLPTGVGTAEIFNDIDDEVLERSFKKWCEDLSTEE